MNSYMKHLMKCISNSRDIALNELTHLGSLEQISKEEVDKWYDNVCGWILKNPPSFYAKYLEVSENYDSKVTAVNYIYFDTNDKIVDASIKVISELYSS